MVSGVRSLLEAQVYFGVEAVRKNSGFRVYALGCFGMLRELLPEG